jgi:hypothetical protein
VFGNRKQKDFTNDSSARQWGWLGAERAHRRARERAAAELISELRWQWRCACSNSPLAPMIYTPSGATRGVPVVAQVDLGPPISFMVRVRPGQTAADFAAAAPSLAPAMNAAALQVIPLASNWIRIVLLPTPSITSPYRTPEPAL